MRYLVKARVKPGCDSDLARAIADNHNLTQLYRRLG
jgi:hypothetical protein